MKKVNNKYVSKRDEALRKRQECYAVLKQLDEECAKAVKILCDMIDNNRYSKKHPVYKKQVTLLSNMCDKRIKKEREVKKLNKDINKYEKIIQYQCYGIKS